ncbi:hypothetical protein [Trinickia acidisoli]|uniref:hypothetical protein n=1 Tax=Trinickia acidisoli TaxID=2767482 RepID=UPI001A8EC1B8|nr:hypothetical protein [Trinickia acidisoli]
MKTIVFALLLCLLWVGVPSAHAQGVVVDDFAVETDGLQLNDLTTQGNAQNEQNALTLQGIATGSSPSSLLPDGYPSVSCAGAAVDSAQLTAACLTANNLQAVGDDVSMNGVENVDVAAAQGIVGKLDELTMEQQAANQVGRDKDEMNQQKDAFLVGQLAALLLP